MIVSDKNNNLLISINGFAYYVLIIAFKKMNYAPYWYNSTLMCLFGMILAKNEVLYFNLTKKNSTIMLLVNFILLAISVYLKAHIVVFELIVVMLILVFLVNFRLTNIILDFIGKISLEIYLFHGLVIKSFRRFISADSNMTSLLILFILIIAVSYIFYHAFKIIDRSVKKTK